MAKSGSQNNPLLILLFITSLLFPELELFSVIFKFEKYIAKESVDTRVADYMKKLFDGGTV